MSLIHTLLAFIANGRPEFSQRHLEQLPTGNRKISVVGRLEGVDDSRWGHSMMQDQELKEPGCDTMQYLSEGLLRGLGAQGSKLNRDFSRRAFSSHKAIKLYRACATVAQTPTPEACCRTDPPHMPVASASIDRRPDLDETVKPFSPVLIFHSSLIASFCRRSELSRQLCYV